VGVHGPALAEAAEKAEAGRSRREAAMTEPTGDALRDRPWLADGPKKLAILAATALLPTRPRVALRERWLAAHELAIARRAGLLIIGHPKSGNTWLKAMLSRLYQVRHGLPASKLIGSDELARLHPAIPRLAATNGYYSYEGIIGQKLDVHAPDPELRAKPTVILVRHPCDIAVSWYHQFTRRQSAHKQELINHFLAHPVDRRTISMWEFVRYSDLGVRSLIEYLNTWERNLAGLERGLLVRYEDLRTEPAVWLHRVVESMGEEFSEAEIAEAVQFASFDNLRQLESRGFFPKQGGLNLRNPSDPNSFKVRRAKIGGYRDDFSVEQVAELDALVAQHLSPSLGYTKESPPPTGAAPIR
jgi:hypothetical protein